MQTFLQENVLPALEDFKEVLVALGRTAEVSRNGRSARIDVWNANRLEFELEFIPSLNGNIVSAEVAYRAGGRPSSEFTFTGFPYGSTGDMCRSGRFLLREFIADLYGSSMQRLRESRAVRLGSR